MTIGKIEVISYKNFGVKMLDQKDWFNAKNPFIKELLKSFKKGEMVEYGVKGRELISITKADQKPEFKLATEVKEGRNLQHLMGECIKDMEELYFSESIDEDFKKLLDWSSHINTLFIQKCRELEKQ
ncbi:MAG: hypothetical protein ABIC57_03995 [bacterium]